VGDLTICKIFVGLRTYHDAATLGIIISLTNHPEIGGGR
jgi:hypothetical protein